MPISTKLILSPPPWQTVLAVVALVLLLIELASLLWWIWQRREPAQAWGMTAAALLAGPVVAIVGGLYGAASRGAGERFALWAWVRAAARSTLVGVLALLIFAWPTGGGVWPPHAAGSIIAIGACSILWALRSYARTTSPLRRRTRAVLVGLRVLVLVLLALWALHPKLESRRYEDLKGTLLVGIDVSRSMAMPDMTRVLLPARAGQEDEAVPRIDAVKAALLRHYQALAALGDVANVRVFTFAGSAGPDRELPASAEDWPGWLPAADGPVTALTDSINAAVGEYFRAGKDVAAVLVLSDGKSNVSYDEAVDTVDKLAKRMGDRGIRLYAAGVGREANDPPGPARILNVTKLTCPEKVDTYNNLPITAAVEAVGLRGRTVQIECRFGGKVVHTETVEVASDSQETAFSHVYVPDTTGVERVEVIARCLGEPPRHLRGTARASQFVHVRERGLQVLYVEGKFRYETKYITQGLTTAQRFTLDRRILIQPLTPEAKPPLSEELEDWLRYNAVILGDVAPSQFTDKQLEILRTLVDEYGKGFGMIGGRKSFDEGLWANTPVAKMMPIDLTKSIGEIKEQIHVVPTPVGLTAELMQIGGEKEDTMKAWEELDSLPGASRFAGLKPGAEVLARAGAGESADPLIVRQRYGKGRVLAIAFDTTWRWVLSPKDTAERQRRFWRQVVLYLAAPKGAVWIETDSPSYDLRKLRAGDQAIVVTAGVAGPTGRPITDRVPKVTLIRPGAPGEQELSLVVNEKMQFVGEVDPRTLSPTKDEPYVLKIEAEVEGKTLSSEHRFEVSFPDLDSRDTVADLETLRRLADATGGEFRRLDAFGELLERLRLQTRPRKELKIDTLDLARRLSWPAIIVMAALLCAEWVARKRKGLV